MKYKIIFPQNSIVDPRTFIMIGNNIMICMPILYTSIQIILELVYAVTKRCHRQPRAERTESVDGEEINALLMRKFITRKNLRAKYSYARISPHRNIFYSQSSCVRISTIDKTKPYLSRSLFAFFF